MKNWLKYGLIFLLIFAVINAIFLPMGAIGIIVPFNLVGLFVATLFGYNMMNSPSIDGHFVLMILVSAVFWFIIGSVVGLIVGKIKSK